MNAEVLNDTVSVGDLIAYPTRSGSFMSTQIAQITDIFMENHPWKEEMRPVLKVHVVNSSYGPEDYRVWIRILNRVVKLNGSPS